MSTAVVDHSPAAVADGRRQVLLGIAAMMLAVAVFAVMEAAVKWLSDGYPTLQIVFFRSAFALLPLGLLLWWRGELRSGIRTRRLSAHLVRSSIGFGSLVGFFYAYGQMPLADVIAIGFAAPICLTALSVWLLAEKVGLHRWSAVVMGLGGVLIMVRPDGGVFAPAASVALAATVLYALAMIQVRRMAVTETAGATVFYFSLLSVVLSGLTLPWNWVTPGPFDAALLVLIGLLGGVGQIALTHAYRLAPVSAVAPFDYVSLLWGVLFGWLLWGDLPAWATLAGAIIVAASGLYILHREAHRPVPRAMPPTGDGSSALGPL